ncbi:MAG: glycosyltransferase [Pseudomonadota bacterium]
MGTSSVRIAFYVQHLLGIGHLYRARRICDALIKTGATVSMIAGGMPSRALEDASFDVVQLPPVRSGDSGFSGLVDVHGQPIDDTFKNNRREKLLQAVSALRPHVVVTEAFPFGRRQMRFELNPLIAQISAQPDGQRPALLCSIRDILQEGRKPERNAETAELINRYYDAVLVHGDPAISQLGDTFPEAEKIGVPIHNTGLVAPTSQITPQSDQTTKPYDIIVTAGGGAVGRELLMAAAEAAAQGQLPGRSIALVTGPQAPPELEHELNKQANGKAEVMTFIADLPRALSQCQLSISQAGYNTVADVLTAGCRAVLVPFADGGETEQSRRANALDRAGRAIALDLTSITSETIARAAERAMKSELRPFAARLDGAERSAALIVSAAQQARRS